MTKEALNLALEALENSVDLVREDAYNAEELYGNYPARQGKVRGLKVLADDHEKAITAIKAALEAKNEKPCPEFWDWLPKAYRHGDVGDEPRFTKYNMEVAFLAGKQSAALLSRSDGEAQTRSVVKDEPVAWRNAAIRLGEELSSVGPDGYYDMDAKEWFDWAMKQKPRGEHSLPQRTWVGLTDEDRFELAKAQYGWEDLLFAAEAKLKEKNT